MTLVAGGVIQADAEIAFGSAVKTLLDFFPRSQQVAEGNQAEVADQRCTQYSSAGACCGNAGNNLNFNFRVVFGNLAHNAGHAVNTSVTTGNHSNGFALQSFVQCQLAAVNLFTHAVGEEFLLLEIFLNQVNVYIVACNNIAGLQCVVGSFGHLLYAAGAEAHNK